jgi:hypothetical protein
MQILVCTYYQEGKKSLIHEVDFASAFWSFEMSLDTLLKPLG